MSPDRTSVSTAFTASPAADEVLVANLPSGSVLTVHHPDGAVREVRADFPDGPLIVAVPGAREVIGWGVIFEMYLAVSRIRNGRHRLDRPVWQRAEKAVRSGGIAYVRYEQRDYFGKSRWTAVDVRQEAGQ